MNFCKWACHFAYKYCLWYICNFFLLQSDPYFNITQDSIPLVWDGSPRKNNFESWIIQFYTQNTKCSHGFHKRIRLDFLSINQLKHQMMSSACQLYISMCNPSDVMYGWVRNTWLHILPLYSFVAHLWLIYLSYLSVAFFWWYMILNWTSP